MNELEKLSRTFPPPDQAKLRRRTHHLSRMRVFYEEKIPDAPERQSWMFQGFVSALVYAVTVIQAYNLLTMKLDKLANDKAEK